MYSSEKSSFAGGCIGLIVALAVVFILLTFAFGTKGVEQGEVCIQTRFGKAVDVVNAGFQTHWPLITDFSCYSIRDNVYEVMDNPKDVDVEKDGGNWVDYPVDTYTSDSQSISVTYSVSYHIEPENALKVYTELAKDREAVKEKSIKFWSRSIVRLLMLNYTAEYLNSGNREEVQQAIEDRIVAEAALQGVTVTNFNLRDIKFDAEYINAVEAQQRVGLLAEEKRLAAEAILIESQAQADAKIIQANADAEVIRIGAEAEANAIEIVGQALAQNPLALQQDFVNNPNIDFMIIPSEGVTPFLPLPTPAQ